MYLSHLVITNFRGISKLCVDFHDGLNVLIGENRTCKTAVLDAIRISLGLSFERRDLYIQHDDFFVDSNGLQSDEIGFDLAFDGATPNQRGLLVELLAIDGQNNAVIELHVRFTRIGERIRKRVWGGAHEGQDIPSVVLELLYFTYLGALRDSGRDLSPSKANRLSQLFLKLVPDDSSREELAKEINSKVQGINAWSALVTQAKNKIEEHLGSIVLSGDDNRVSVQFVDATFREIVEGLRIRMPRGVRQSPISPGEQDADPIPSEAPSEGQQTAELPTTYFNIAQNSLGYNNLLYIATVLGDLVERRERAPDSYAALLIEEPEAHLHPQWQNTLFHYLRSMKECGIQVFISSHSPTITAKSDIDSLIALSRDAADVSVTPLQSMSLTEQSKKHLQRFLDVTKAQLFFARRVVLVEGISEALLLPALASAMKEKYDLDREAVEVINVAGVAFEPFASLFNSNDMNQRLAVRCALLTDDDRDSTGAVSPRAQKAMALAGGNLKVFLSAVTFEYEMYTSNEDLILRAYKALHPKTDLTFTGDMDARAKAFVEKLNANKDKAILAQHLAVLLQDDKEHSSLVVPNYIELAIRWAITGDASTPK